MARRDARKIDTRAIGLDAGLALMRWLTGAENLHYGDFEGLPSTAANLGPAQEAYTARLFTYLPPPPGRLLDVGGGAGVTAAKLLALGYDVEIVVPSSYLAGRCRENAPSALVHETTFEAFKGEGPFDVILFSESWQYIPQEVSLPVCARLLAPGGTLLIADCFRSDAYEGVKRSQTVGGGHRLSAFRTHLTDAPFDTVSEADITAAVAPSIDIEQGLFNVIGHAAARVDTELGAKRPRTRWALATLWRMALSERRRFRLRQRLMEQARTSEAFCHHNRYMIFQLTPHEPPRPDPRPDL